MVKRETVAKVVRGSTVPAQLAKQIEMTGGGRPSGWMEMERTEWKLNDTPQ